MLIDEYGEPLDRPYLTKITDSYARCIMGIHLGFDAPSSQVATLALRHAILLSRYIRSAGWNWDGDREMGKALLQPISKAT